VSAREDVVFSPLVADVISASLSMTHQVTDQLIESLTKQVADLTAELEAVRIGVHDLVGGRYMPTPIAILGALYPSDAAIDACRESDES
jgi:hypothetical protein